MTRIVILGGPRTGKTTLAEELHRQQMAAWGRPIVDIEGPLLRHSDDEIDRRWSEASARVARYLDDPGPWIIEGVALARALRKWREAHPGEPPPVDRVIRLTAPYVELTKGQATMAKGEETVWREIEPWLVEHGVEVEHR